MTYGEEDPQFLEHIKEAWPGLPEDEYPDLLMSVTSFPFGKAAKVIEQLTRMYRDSGGDVDKAMAIADDEMSQAHDEYKRKHEPERQQATTPPPKLRGGA